jgi:hypothetical protein
MYASNVEKPLFGTLPLKHMKEITLEKNFMHVSSVTKPSFI